ncbi:hypothetical protein ACFXPZ_12995 [Streptomyces sp. NPDC059101]|uniref:hypothetical protein n=1 Tax=Streptomyces sp. NPDC059101 TaxID=3346728 RepID=UPI0036AE8CB4
MPRKPATATSSPEALVRHGPNLLVSRPEAVPGRGIGTIAGSITMRSPPATGPAGNARDGLRHHRATVDNAMTGSTWFTMPGLGALFPDP